MGRCGYFLASEVSLRLEIWPTSLIGGEGLIAGLLHVAKSEIGGDGDGGGSGMGGGRMDVNRDGVDVRLKLHSPS